MKRYLSIILAALFLLASVDALARPILSPQKVVFRGTITGLLISAVDGGGTASGGAFLDGLSGTLETFNSPILHENVAVTGANSKISASAVAAFYDDASGVNLQAHILYGQEILLRLR